MAQNEVYLGNPNLKKGRNIAQDFTKEQIAEFILLCGRPSILHQDLCANRIFDLGLIPFDMYHFQEEMVQKFHENRFNIAKLPRQ